METLELDLAQSEKGFLGGGVAKQKGRERRQDSCSGMRALTVGDVQEEILFVVKPQTGLLEGLIIVASWKDT